MLHNMSTKESIALLFQPLTYKRLWELMRGSHLLPYQRPVVIFPNGSILTQQDLDLQRQQATQQALLTMRPQTSDLLLQVQNHMSFPDAGGHFTRT